MTTPLPDPVKRAREAAEANRAAAAARLAEARTATDPFRRTQLYDDARRLRGIARGWEDREAAELRARADYDEAPRPAPVTPASAKLIGAGDGSVMLYCGDCRECLAPNVRTLDVAVETLAEHVAAVHRVEEPA